MCVSLPLCIRLTDSFNCNLLILKIGLTFYIYAVFCYFWITSASIFRIHKTCFDTEKSSTPDCVGSTKRSIIGGKEMGLVLLLSSASFDNFEFLCEFCWVNKIFVKLKKISLGATFTLLPLIPQNQSNDQPHSRTPSWHTLIFNTLHGQSYWATYTLHLNPIS